MTEKLPRINVPVSDSTRNKLNFLLNADIEKGKQTQSQFIERLINEEYERVTGNK
uniref:hypothetical protein n=1 Tax=Streptococcus pluranimalium TaxID=82348 RepID=UPI003F68DBFA